MPNKAKSKRQYRFLQAVAHGRARKGKGLSKDKAAEMLGGQSPKGLPERARSAMQRLHRRRVGR